MTLDLPEGRRIASIPATSAEVEETCADIVRSLQLMEKAKIDKNRELSLIRENYDKRITEHARVAREKLAALDVYVTENRLALTGGKRKMFKTVTAVIKWYFRTLVQITDDEKTVIDRIKALGREDTFVTKKVKIKESLNRSQLATDPEFAKLVGATVEKVEHWAFIPHDTINKFVRAAGTTVYRLLPK
jgi:phage host-nuclease inhibitor protein Gam